MARPPKRAVSLRRALSKLGVASRTEAEALITAGRVRVGNRVVHEPGWRVDLDVDPIRIDGKRASAEAPQYWLLNKPVGYVTTRRDPQGRRTVYDLLPSGLPFLSPVGRLDLQSCGLLLLTNDTQLGAYLTDPRSHVQKTYEVELDGPILNEAAQLLAAGVLIGMQKTLPARVELCGTEPCALVLITIVEGRNRQVRRMFETLGRSVVRLRRVGIGPLRIEGLEDGTSRELRPAEVRALLRLKHARG